jgi:L-serine dehydratase
MYNTISQLISASREKPMHEVIIDDEMALTGVPRGDVYLRMHTSFSVIQKSALKALDTPQHMTPPLIKGQSSLQHKYADGATLCGKEVNEMMAMALSASEVNASMGRICAAPTAGSCGILPAVITTAAKKLGSNKNEIAEALIVASGIGAVIMRNATVSGAEGGCQAECGAAAAMAAAACVYLSHGTPQMCAEAVSIALINCMGLVCDPVAGLVQLPCSFRNASQSANALSSADMALAGQTCPIPADEVIEALFRVGHALPSSLRETAEGGIAATQTGKKISAEFFAAK